MELFLYIVTLLIITCIFYFWVRYKNDVVHRGNVPFVFLFIVGAVVFTIIYFSFRLITIDDSTIIGGMDSVVYKERFENATGNLFVSLKEQGYEFGYGFFVYFIRLFTDNYSIFQIIYYLITFGIIFKTLTILKPRANLLTFILLFLYITIPFAESVNITRHSLSYFVALLTFAYLTKGKNKIAFILAIVSTSLHIAGFIILFIALFNLFRFKRNLVTILKNGLILAVFFVAGFFVLRTMLSSTRYILYFSSADGSIPYGLLFERVFVLLLLLLLVGNATLDKPTSMAILLVTIGILMSFLQIILPILYRVNVFCGIGCLFILSRGNELLKNQRSSNRQLLEICVVFLFAIRLVSFINNSIASEGLLPHYYIWETL